MPEIDEAINEAIEHAEKGSGLNSAVAILVAITATFMALCNIKDDNIVQNMEHSQSKAVDTWSYYQSKSLKQHVQELGLALANQHLAADGNLTPQARTVYQTAVTSYTKEIKRYDSDKKKAFDEAKGYEAHYDALNVHDDQFDSASAFFSISIAMAGITALTRKKWLFFVALSLSVLGIIFGLAGFVGWNLHPEWLAKLLS